jgi:clan AA aspartic protease
VSYHAIETFDLGVKIMGQIYADITLVNGIDAGLAQRGDIPSEKVRKIEVKALVDSGANLLTIDQTIADQLDLMVEYSTEVELADGTHRKCNLVGPVSVRFKNRRATCSALVLPGASEVLLGVIPLEAMDVIIDPLAEQLALPPDRPYLSLLKVK